VWDQKALSWQPHEWLNINCAWMVYCKYNTSLYGKYKIIHVWTNWLQIWLDDWLKSIFVKIENPRWLPLQDRVSTYDPIYGEYKFNLSKKLDCTQSVYPYRFLAPFTKGVNFCHHSASVVDYLFTLSSSLKSAWPN
jgi:hypothetical protein